jgi:hypothetical protein
MNDPLKIVRNYIESGDDLGKSVSEEEANKLVISLRNRLGESPEQLDLSPTSLDFLAKSLLSYFNKNNFQKNEMPRDDLVKFIREIASYLGLVLTRNTDGNWDSGKNFGLLMIKYEKKQKKKNLNSEKISKYSIDLFFSACTTISALQMSVEPKLFLLYKSARSSRVKEIL